MTGDQVLITTGPVAIADLCWLRRRGSFTACLLQGKLASAADRFNQQVEPINRVSAVGRMLDPVARSQKSEVRQRGQACWAIDQRPT